MGSITKLRLWPHKTMTTEQVKMLLADLVIAKRELEIENAELKKSITELMKSVNGAGAAKTDSKPEPEKIL